MVPSVTMCKLGGSILQPKRSFSAANFAEPKLQSTVHGLLVVLDLNGTVVYRAKNSSGRSIPNGRVTSRPYLGAFLHYCLGNRVKATKTKSWLESWPKESRETIPYTFAPHGSDLWIRSGTTVTFPPRSRVNILVWSSATQANVHHMVNHILGSPAQALVQRVWSRDTLVPSPQLNKKVSTTKDLNLLWNELNAWEKYLVERHRNDERPDIWSQIVADRRCYKRTTLGDISNKEADLELDSPWGAHNTLIVDDSEYKARYHPNNHICIPEYTRKEQSIYVKYLAQQAAKERSASTLPAGADHEDTELINEADLDDALLQIVGVLDAVAHVENVSAWVRDGGLAQLFTESSPWAERGRVVLESLNIPVEP